MIKPLITDKSLLTAESAWVNSPYVSLEVGNDLRDTAATLKDCGGLAAPQIGHLHRVILVHVQGKAMIMVNPVILERKGKRAWGEERCFSVLSSFKWPKRVKRFFKIKVKFNAETGDITTMTFKGHESRLIQHEIDHLDGKLIG